MACRTAPPIDWRPRRRRTSSSTPTTRSTGGSGAQDAFAAARERGVPVLLSVGYSACHWCHVMAHESFEDDATASYLNEHYVSVKVDREERPDVDAIYMQATTAMTGHGGWPMTVVLDHEGNPFFAGTYFPDRARGGMPAFRQVLEAVHEAWTARPDDVRRVAADLRDHLQRSVSGTSAPIDTAVLDAAVARLWTERDDLHGGLRLCQFLGPEVPAVDGARGTAAPRVADRLPPRAGDGGRDVRGDGARWDVRPAGRRLREVRGRPGVGGAALREDALRQRAAAGRLRPVGHGVGGAGRRGDCGLPGPRAGDRGGRAGSRARRRLRG